MRRLVFDLVREIVSEARRPVEIFFKGSRVGGQDYAITVAFDEDLVAIKTIRFWESALLDCVRF